jgi:hypothetical protein
MISAVVLDRTATAVAPPTASSSVTVGGAQESQLGPGTSRTRRGKHQCKVRGALTPTSVGATPPT